MSDSDEFPTFDDRSDYQWGSLDEAAFNAIPLRQVAAWIAEAKLAGAIEPTAMCLATVDEVGRPSSRMVLTRDITDGWLTFFSNYESRKGRELDNNPTACATFWWAGIERQIRVEGTIERSPADESDAYFASRPRESQLASACSPQSSVISSREEIQTAIADLSRQYPDHVPRPPHWGGYRLIPTRVEFWQGRPARLHDRLVYIRDGELWRKEWLAP